MDGYVSAERRSLRYRCSRESLVADILYYVVLMPLFFSISVRRKSLRRVFLSVALMQPVFGQGRDAETGQRR
jgi:hypothetical protein